MVAMKDKNVNNLQRFGVLYALSFAALTAACDLRDFVPIPGISVVQPKNEALVTTPVYFELDAKNWDIEPPSAQRDGAGYFVLILQGGCQTPGRLMPFEPQYVHLADGAFTAWVDLSPGTYEVCVQVADGNHRAMNLTEMVKFEVVD